MENMDVSSDILKSVKATIQIQFSTPCQQPVKKGHPNSFLCVVYGLGYPACVSQSERKSGPKFKRQTLLFQTAAMFGCLCFTDSFVEGDAQTVA